MVNLITLNGSKGNVKLKMRLSSLRFMPKTPLTQPNLWHVDQQRQTTVVTLLKSFIVRSGHRLNSIVFTRYPKPPA